ncbi:MAG: glycosyltransferase family 2 protein [Candidatus Omnitrophica bacterium]|nr:glycosyltransferase family 2 protein [Candidatus Omnitrophota bacterium]
MWRQKTISVVLPAYNEGENIVEVIEQFLAMGSVDELVVVDNNSFDNTAIQVQSTGAKLVFEKRQGFGYALRRGLKQARGDYIIISEPDGTFMPSDIIKLLNYADEFDMVLGSRTRLDYVWEGANMGRFLRLGNIIVAKLCQFLYNTPPLSDCGCTMRLIKREALEKIIDKFRVGGSHFLPEMVILSKRYGLSFIEIPVNYKKRVGVSKITGSLRGILKTGLNMLWLILNYRLKTI